MATSEPLIWEIGFYVALAALIAVLLIKKRKQTRDSIDIDTKNQPKNEEE